MSVPLDLVAWLVQEKYIILTFLAVRALHASQVEEYVKIGYLLQSVPFLICKRISRHSKGFANEFALVGAFMLLSFLPSISLLTSGMVRYHQYWWCAS